MNCFMTPLFSFSLYILFSLYPWNFSIYLRNLPLSDDYDSFDIYDSSDISDSDQITDLRGMDQQAYCR